MIDIKIDGRPVSVEIGGTVLDAARILSIEIPTLCYLKELGHITSCMICSVRDRASGRLVPACSTPAVQGMDIETDSEPVRQHRKAALELLLSEHIGDCEGPCRRARPAAGPFAVANVFTKEEFQG